MFCLPVYKKFDLSDGVIPIMGRAKDDEIGFFFRFWGNLSRPALQERTKVSSFAGTTNYARENYKI